MCASRLEDPKIASLQRNVDELSSTINNLTSKTQDVNNVFSDITRKLRVYGTECQRLKNENRSNAQAGFALDALASALSDCERTFNEKKTTINNKLLKQQQRAMQSPEDKLYEQQREEAQQQEQSQATYQAAILQDRNEQIHELYRDTQVVNEMTQDMNHLLNQQTDMLRIAEDNAYTAAQRIEGGADDLAKAEKHTKRNKKLTCGLVLLILGILIAAGAIVGITLGVVLRKK
ncbi:hypothetical protein BLNAU_2156 [Blattamonas nauphoetae]|uniref:t-SNARE coiled-coil homology domain-containing protein n=1 Tax=Blattamonas nauphoetae TaxID=2049346 RepID=A0ABQ9YGA3_9EUKA|nr:hypothetical protein BLNAU_2156 [Blattamonas nauphoetae]